LEALGGIRGGRGGVILDIDGGNSIAPDTDNGYLSSAGGNNAAPSSNCGNASIIGVHGVGTLGAIDLSASEARRNTSVVGVHGAKTLSAINLDAGEARHNALDAGGHDDTNVTTTNKVARATSVIHGIGRAWPQLAQQLSAHATAFGSPSSGRFGPATCLALPLCDNIALGVDRGSARRTKDDADGFGDSPRHESCDAPNMITDDTISDVTIGKDWPMPKGGVAESIGRILVEGELLGGVARVPGVRDDSLDFHLGEQVHLLQVPHRDMCQLERPLHQRSTVRGRRQQRARRGCRRHYVGTSAGSGGSLPTWVDGADDLGACRDGGRGEGVPHARSWSVLRPS
jgi:hypothetical protein